MRRPHTPVRRHPWTQWRNSNGDLKLNIHPPPSPLYPIAIYARSKETWKDNVNLSFRRPSSHVAQQPARSLAA